MAEGQLKMIVANPTQNGTDGTLASQVLQSYPINLAINTGESNHMLYKIALRCDDGWQTIGTWEVSFIGTTSDRWSIADGASYPNEALAEYAEYAPSITGDAVIGSRNHVLWLKAETDGTEPAQVDTSVQVRVYGRCVPSGGA